MNFCTYFDSNYLKQGLVLLRSIWAFHPKARIFVLCLDQGAHDALNALYRDDKRLVFFPLVMMETPALLQVKAKRSWKDYIFTLTPRWMALCMETFALDHVAYIDSDCFLFDSLDPLYEEVGRNSIAIIPHRWTPRLVGRLRASGEFNVGWVYIRNDQTGKDCLARWLEQGLAWTGRMDTFSDQIYLNEWPEQYKGKLHRVAHLGAGLAPWNQEQYAYDWDFPSEGKLLITQTIHRHKPIQNTLLFYHFHGWRSPENRGGYTLDPAVVTHIYEPYENALSIAEQYALP